MKSSYIVVFAAGYARTATRCRACPGTRSRLQARLAVVLRLQPYSRLRLTLWPVKGRGYLHEVEQVSGGVALEAAADLGLGVRVGASPGEVMLVGSVAVDHAPVHDGTSRNVTGGWLTDTALGGLNYQIEHHLFPAMPTPNLRKAQPIVEAY